LGKNKCADCTEVHVEIEDFAPFHIRKGQLWVPYLGNGVWRMHSMDPLTAWKGVGFVLRACGGGGKVVPFALEALRRGDRTSGHG